MAFGDYNYKLEVYNQANSSKLCEFIRTDFFSGEVVQEVDGEDSLTFQIPKTHAHYIHLVKFNVVRLCDTKAGTYVVYRIKSVRTWRQRNKLLAEVYCEHLKYDLVGRIINEEKHFVQANPRDVLDYILGFSDGFTRGTCAMTFTIDFDISYESCMSAINRLAEVQGYEWEVLADAAPLYKVVNILTIGTGMPVTIQYGTNLKSIKHDSEIGSDFATRLVPRGGAALAEQRKLDYALMDKIKPGTMDVGGAAFTVKDWSAITRWLQITSTNLLAADDALNGYWVVVADETVEIVDSKKSTGGDEIQLESAPPDVAVGGRVFIFETALVPASTVPNLALESTYLRTEQIFTCDDLPDILNVAGPEGYSDLSGTYTGGICQGWTTINQVSCQENTDTDYIRTGSKSMRIYCAGEGDGVKRTVNCGSARAASFYIWVYISAIDEDAKLYVRLKVGEEDDDYFPRNADTGLDEAYITETGWRQIICEGGILSGVGTHDLEIFASGGSVTFYLDSVMVQCSEYITDEDVFYPWDTRVILWEKAVARLNEISAPKETINLEIVDLFEADRDAYPYSQITPGTDLEIVDTAMGFDVTEVRTRRKTWNLIRPWECRLEVEG